MPRSQALRVLRDGLITGGLPRVMALLLTLPSLRVFAPSRAFREGIDRTRRSALGRWAAEATADIYVRGHAETVEYIWERIRSSAFTESGWTQPPSSPVDANILGPTYFPPEPEVVMEEEELEAPQPQSLLA